MRIKSRLVIIVVCASVLFACNRDKNVNSDPIPEIPVNTTINLAIKAPFLDVPGSFFYETGGFRGLAVIHDFDGAIRVFDRTCSFQPQSSCNRLYVDTLSLQFKCGNYDSLGFTTCCESRFDFSGFVQRQPAVFPLKQYRTSRSGNLLNVVN